MGTGPWAADGSGFYFLSDDGREFRGLAFYDVEAGGWDWVETPEADIEEVGVSRDGRVLAWLVNEDGWDVLKLRDLETGHELPEPNLPRGARPPGQNAAFQSVNSEKISCARSQARAVMDETGYPSRA